MMLLLQGLFRLVLSLSLAGGFATLLVMGARVLARFQPQICREDYQLLCLLNANRPEIRTPEAAAAYLRAIEETTGLTCSGLVNNTHLCGETTPAEVRRGAAPCSRLAAADSRVLARASGGQADTSRAANCPLAL